MYLKEIAGNSELRQRINLSHQARAVLEQDRTLFLPGSSESGFYNDIIGNYKAWGNLSASQQLREQQAVWDRLFRDLLDNCVKAAVIEALPEDYLRQKREVVKTLNAEKGSSISIRLNNANFEKLYGEEFEKNVAVYNRPSVYLKELFEQFAKLPGCRREAFYFRDIIRTVASEAHVQDFTKAGIITNATRFRITLGRQSFFLRPYKLMADTEQQHVYLVGLSQVQGEAERITSFRLSTLAAESTTVEAADSGKAYLLTRGEKQDIEEKIRKNGVQYLVAQDQLLIKLQLNQYGEKLYHQKVHQRPAFIEKTAGGIYVFDCSERQIFNYFFSFGANVQILEPASLRHQFAESYRQAYKLYQNT